MQSMDDFHRCREMGNRDCYCWGGVTLGSSSLLENESVKCH